jgi:MYXO-CTERM domain-containing protein
VAPVAADQLYTVDLAGAEIAAGSNSFVLAPEPGDSNGVHLDSKEAAGMRGAVLRLTIDPTQPPTSDAGAPVTDSGVTMLDAGSRDDAGSARDAGSRRDAGGLVTDAGCACRSQPASPGQGRMAIAALSALAVALAARRRRHDEFTHPKGLK